MDIKNTVIVTALFDIGRDKWDNFTMSYHTYCHWMRNILYLDSKLIIYIDEKFKDDVIRFRKEVDPNLEKTIILVQKLEEIDGYKIFYEKLNSLMSSDAFKAKVQFDVPEMNKPLYNVVMFSKLFYILDAYNKKLFDADLYVWADAGVIRDDKPKKNEIWPDSEKINALDNSKVTFFSHHSRVSIHNKESHALSQMRFIQGGSIFVPKGCVEDICEEFKMEALNAIDSGYVGSDEKIFDFVYIKNPSKYNLIKCKWREYLDLFKTVSPIAPIDKTKKIFIDMGSHDGRGLDHFVSLLGINEYWDVYAFEPNHLVGSEEKLKRIYNKVIFSDNALWTRNGTITFGQYGADGKSEGSLVQDTGGSKNYGDHYKDVTVNCISAYEFIKNLQAGVPVYIKMDLEWSEYEILSDMLSKGWPKNIKKLWVGWHGKYDRNNIMKADLLRTRIKIEGTEIEDWH
jgi:FkbM family methyltransferase